MCEFFSAIVLKNGDAVWDSTIDNHSKLVELANIQDDTTDTSKMKFARVEITPPDHDIFADIEKWILKIDETITPAWFKKRHEDAAWSALQECLKEVLIYKQNIKNLNKKRCWIKDSYIEYIYGGTVEYIEGGMVKNIKGGTVENIKGGTVKNIKGGTVENIYGGTITVYNNHLPKKMSGDRYMIIDKSNANPVILTGNKNIKIKYQRV